MIPKEKDYGLLRSSLNSALKHFLQYLTFGIYSRPQKVDIHPTYRCNLRCKHCFLHRNLEDELSTEKWKEIITKLNKWLDNFFLIIAGGEPLMRSDLCEIINFSHRLGNFNILSTNGTLIDEQTADKLVASGLDTICVSLDGFKEETHNFLRGQGGHQKALNSIGYLKNRIKMQITTTIMDYNLDEILDLVEFAEINGIGISFQGLFWRINNRKVYYDAQDNELWPKDIQKAECIMNKLITKKMKGGNIRNSVRHLKLIKSSYTQPPGSINYHCQSNKENFTVIVNGDVNLCGEFGSIGNLISESPKDIWGSRKAAYVKEQITKCHFNCSFLTCRFRENFLEKTMRFKDTILR